MAKDIVTIRCYNKEEQMERSDAIQFYREAVIGSDGSERGRYVEILTDLYEGLTYCSDKE